MKAISFTLILVRVTLSTFDDVCHEFCFDEQNRLFHMNWLVRKQRKNLRQLDLGKYLIKRINFGRFNFGTKKLSFLIMQLKIFGWAKFLHVLLTVNSCKNERFWLLKQNSQHTSPNVRVNKFWEGYGSMGDYFIKEMAYNWIIS